MRKNDHLGRLHTPVELFCVKSDSSCGVDKVRRSLKKKVKEMMIMFGSRVREVLA